MKFTPPVLLQTYRDEFELPTKEYETPDLAGQVLSKITTGKCCKFLRKESV